MWMCRYGLEMMYFGRGLVDVLFGAIFAERRRGKL